MKLLAALVAFSFQVAQGRRLQTDTVPAYSAEQCDSWLAAASTFDADASGGISTDEYFAILQSLELVTVATSYAELDFAAKMSFTTIACMCKSLGLGDTCCEGEDAEIPLSVLSTEGDPVVDAYKADLCNVLASVILDEGATLPPVATPTLPPLATPTTSPGEPEEVVPATNTTAEPVPAPVVVEPAPEEPKGLSTVAIIFIVLAVILTPIAILVGREKYRKMKEQERLERLRQYEASQASRSVKVAVVADVADDDEFYDPAENKKSTAGSSLAAMGAAGTAAAIFGNIPSR
jgi:hypothetical protein